jgi:hypothetical protein
MFVTLALLILAVIASRTNRWFAVGSVLIVILLAVVAIGMAGPRVSAFMESAGGVYGGYVENRSSTSGEEGGLSNAIYTVPVALSVPLRILVGLVQPVPLFTSDITYNYQKLGSVVWFLWLPFLIGGLLETCRRATTEQGLSRRAVGAAYLLLFLPVVIVTMQTRQVTMYFPLGVVLAVSQMEQSGRRVYSKMSWMVVLGVVFVLLWILYRLAR